MPFARFVRRSWLVLALGLAGFGGGCGSGQGQHPVTKEEDARIREDMKSAHQQIRDDAKKARGAAGTPGGMMKAARRQGAGR
jgi:hypothetical protein